LFKLRSFVCNIAHLCINHICVVGDFMYPTEPDYEGTKDTLPPLLSSRADDLTDSSCGLNRLVFSNRDTVRSLAQVDTTLRNTAAADDLLQKGTVIVTSKL